MKCEKYATYALFPKSFHRFFGGYPERIVKVKLIYDASQKCAVKKRQSRWAAVDHWLN